jgi:hypothetical protein
MTTLAMLLGLVGLIGFGVAVVLRELRGASGDRDWQAVEGRLLSPAHSEIYGPMGRLFSDEDFIFLRSQPGFQRGLEDRLRHQRRHALRCYLRELRADFRQLYGLCRFRARTSGDPDFATLITQQALIFYGLFLALQVRCYLGWLFHARVDANELVSAFDRLLQVARASIGAMTQQVSLSAGAA